VQNIRCFQIFFDNLSQPSLDCVGSVTITFYMLPALNKYVVFLTPKSLRNLSTYHSVLPAALNEDVPTPQSREGM
jgi:hypothetical protein